MREEWNETHVAKRQYHFEFSPHKPFDRGASGLGKIVSLRAAVPSLSSSTRRRKLTRFRGDPKGSCFDFKLSK